MMVLHLHRLLLIAAAFAALLASVIGSSVAQQCDGTDVVTGTGQHRCSRAAAARSFKDCAECPEMVVAPAGSFTMGSPADELERSVEREEPVRVTFARPFAIGAFAVTRGEFAVFAAETGHWSNGGCYVWTGTTWEERADRSWRSPGFEQDELHPVTCVDLNDARAYAAWLSAKTGKTYRLPSEAEREYATRAGTTTPFWWGHSISTDRANYNGGQVYGGGAPGVWLQQTVRVDRFRANAWGLYNVHGNVWDWTEDCWSESNSGNPGDGTARVTGDCRWRVVRGGAWNYSPNYLRAAFRYWNVPHNRSGVQSFRVIREL